jgi:hypothetical protein
VQLAFLRRLPQLDWMTSDDKIAAADKLAGMVSEPRRLQLSEGCLRLSFARCHLPACTDATAATAAFASLSLLGFARRCEQASPAFELQRSATERVGSLRQCHRTASVQLQRHA